MLCPSTECSLSAAVWIWACGDSHLLLDCSSSSHHCFLFLFGQLACVTVLCESCIFPTGYKILQFFFYVVCFSVSSLGSSSSSGQDLQPEYWYYWSWRFRVPHCYRQELMLAVSESLQEFDVQVLISFSPKRTLCWICSVILPSLSPRAIYNLAI